MRPLLRAGAGCKTACLFVGFPVELEVMGLHRHRVLLCWAEVLVAPHCKQAAGDSEGIIAGCKGFDNQAGDEGAAFDSLLHLPPDPAPTGY